MCNAIQNHKENTVRCIHIVAVAVNEIFFPENFTIQWTKQCFEDLRFW